MARRTAKRKERIREVENAIDLLISSYETLCKNLIEHGSLDLYAMRKLMNVIIDIAIKYDIKTFLRPLGLVVGRDRLA